MNDNWMVFGRNAVRESLKKDSASITCIYIRSGEKTGSLGEIVAAARKAGIPIKEIPVSKLDFMSGGLVHQGIAVSVSAHEYVTVDVMLTLAAEKQEPPFLVVTDGIEDPHNLGAIIRTAECAGAHGVIIPKRRNVQLTPAVAKTAAGACSYVPIARADNTVMLLRQLKEKGLWIFGADMDGEAWHAADYKCPMALVIGGEGRGVTRLVRESCDFLVSLPMKGHITSLNASVACGIIMYEISRQRNH